MGAAINTSSLRLLLQKSAKPTNDNSPPIHRWDFGATGPSESVKRTAESKPRQGKAFSRPLHGLNSWMERIPSAKALGYFHSVRFADEAEPTFAAKPALRKESPDFVGTSTALDHPVDPDPNGVSR